MTSFSPFKKFASVFEGYVFKNLAIVTVITAVVLAAIILLTQSLRFLELIIESGASSGAFWMLTLLALPRFFEVILPIATMIGCLFIYNRMHSDSEIVVMRAAGSSPLSLARPAISLALIVTIILMFITTWLAPVALSSMQQMRQVIKAQYSSLLLREGVFNQMGDDLTVYVHNKNKEGELEGIIIHDSRDKNKAPVSVLAQKGVILLSPEGQKVLVYEGSRQDYNAKTTGLNRLDFERYTIDLPESDEVRLRWKEPDERTFFELLNPDKTVARDVDNTKEFLVEAHRRIVTPFLALTFTSLVLVFLLLGPVNRRGQSVRVMGAVFSVIILQSIYLSAVNKASDNTLGIILMYVFVFVPMIVSFIMLSPSSEILRQRLLFKQERVNG